MRILVHDYCGHPFGVQLSRQLAKRGYQVLHIYSSSFQTPKGTLIKQDLDPDSFNVQGISLGGEFHKYNLFKRQRQEIEYGRLLAEKVLAFGPDAVISANTPLDAQKALLQACKNSQIRFIFWLQDIISVAISRILRKRFLGLGALIGTYYKRLERKLLHQSNYIVAITEDFRPILTGWISSRP